MNCTRVIKKAGAMSRHAEDLVFTFPSEKHMLLYDAIVDILSNKQYDEHSLTMTCFDAYQPLAYFSKPGGQVNDQTKLAALAEQCLHDMNLDVDPILQHLGTDFPALVQVIRERPLDVAPSAQEVQQWQDVKTQLLLFCK